MAELETSLAAIDITGAQLIPLAAITLTMLVAIVGVIMWAIVSTVQSRETERSRREIAAYVSEGSITPEEGERLLQAGPPKNKCGV